MACLEDTDGESPTYSEEAMDMTSPTVETPPDQPEQPEEREADSPTPGGVAAMLSALSLEERQEALADFLPAPRPTADRATQTTATCICVEAGRLEVVVSHILHTTPPQE
jgi:hypothetical protein